MVTPSVLVVVDAAHGEEPAALCTSEAKVYTAAAGPDDLTVTGTTVKSALVISGSVWPNQPETSASDGGLRRGGRAGGRAGVAVVPAAPAAATERRVGGYGVAIPIDGANSSIVTPSSAARRGDRARTCCA